jgi:hypothetical protein
MPFHERECLFKLGRGIGAARDSAISKCLEGTVNRGFAASSDEAQLMGIDANSAFKPDNATHKASGMVCSDIIFHGIKNLTKWLDTFSAAKRLTSCRQRLPKALVCVLVIGVELVDEVRRTRETGHETIEKSSAVQSTIVKAFKLVRTDRRVAKMNIEINTKRI